MVIDINTSSFTLWYLSPLRASKGYKFLESSYAQTLGTLYCPLLSPAVKRTCVMSLVDFLVHYYLGNAQFTREQNRALIQTAGMA